MKSCAHAPRTCCNRARLMVLANPSLFPLSFPLCLSALSTRKPAKIVSSPRLIHYKQVSSAFCNEIINNINNNILEAKRKYAYIRRERRPSTITTVSLLSPRHNNASSINRSRRCPPFLTPTPELSASSVPYTRLPHTPHDTLEAMWGRGAASEGGLIL